MSPGSRRALLAALTLFAAVTLLALAATAGAATAGATAAAQADAVANDTTTVIKVTLDSDGDARWSVTEHFNVSGPVDRAAFEQLANRFEDGESRQLGLSAFREALARVEPTVERSMRIHDVERSTSVEDGTLEMAFTWENFARTDNETRIVDDVFTTEQGTWFDGLGPNQTLIVELPPGSALDTPKAVTDSTIRWEGPTTFEPGYLQISYTAEEGGLSILVWVLALALVLTIVGVAGAYVLSRRRDAMDVPEVPLGTAEDDAEAGAGHAASSATAAGGDAEADESEPDDDGVDLSLLSDEERVEYLIEQNGGRMKQANIVKETGWSNAKVSQLLSAMEEEGRIQKLRIGRENLISFPDEDIGDFEDS